MSASKNEMGRAQIESENDHANSDALIAGVELFCERDDRILFDGLNLSLKAGELVQLAGPNGAGKTTLLRILAGLNRDFEGQVLWQGKDLHRHYEQSARDRLYLGHLSAVKKALTPIENLRWFLSPWSNITDDDIFNALAEVKLAGYEDVICQQLSAGQHRRVALARLLLTPSKLWILDEPFTALDVEGVAWLETLIAKKVEDGGAVLITSHHALSDIAGLRRIELGYSHPYREENGSGS